MASGLEVLAHLVVAAVFKTVEPYVNRAVGGFDSHALPPFFCAVGRTLRHHGLMTVALPCWRIGATGYVRLLRRIMHHLCAAFCTGCDCPAKISRV